jgi:hypothetical protein
MSGFKQHLTCEPNGIANLVTLLHRILRQYKHCGWKKIHTLLRAVSHIKRRRIDAEAESYPIGQVRVSLTRPNLSKRDASLSADYCTNKSVQSCVETNVDQEQSLVVRGSSTSGQE